MCVICLPRWLVDVIYRTWVVVSWRDTALGKYVMLINHINSSSSKQRLVSGARIAAYNFATGRLIAESKAPINSLSLW